MRRLSEAHFDVIILGTGIAGTILGTILGRHGHRVLLLDSGTHPRFAIGESTIPQTSQLFQLLANQHDVPELAVLGLKSPRSIRERIAPTSGIKRLFGFVYHQIGREHRPEQAHQFGNAFRDENHLFRQDIDAWLLTVAMSYGCEVIQSVQVKACDFDDDKCQVRLTSGQCFTGRYLVDGTGFRSVLAALFGLREEPNPMVASSRSLFTHMIDIKDFESVAKSYMSHPFKLGTLHHIFERGWFWVIPFNNWEGAPNPLVSVGLTLDDRAYPEDPAFGPEEEFAKYVEMLPSVAKQFENARAVRPWVRTKRIQYRSTRTIGKRWTLLSHAAGFVDALFSRGLISTMENIRELCDVLLPALSDDDFSEERFDGVDRQQQKAVTFADRIVAGAYVSFDDFELWNMWVRLWAIGAHTAESNLGAVLTMGKYSKFQSVPDPLCSRYELPGFRAYFELSYRAIMEYEAGKRTVAETRLELEQALARFDFSIPLRDKSTGHEWAFRQPLCRDIFLGVPGNHERWQSHRADAHLAG